MRTRTSIFQIIEVIDSIVSRTHLVLNTNLSQPTDEQPDEIVQWVCWTKPEDSLESELASHLPLYGSLKVSLVNLLFDSSTSPPLFYPFKEVKPWKVKRINEELQYEFSVNTDAYQSSVEAIASLFGEDLDRLLKPMLGQGSQDPSDPPVVPNPNTASGPPVERSDLLRMFNPAPKLKTFEAPVKTPFLDGETVIVATLADLSPIPKYKGYRPSGVPEIYIQILFGIRAILLSLIDSSGGICHTPEGDPDRDYIGNLSASDVYSAMELMSKWDITDFVPNCKYWKDFPLASCLANDLPAVPESWTKYDLTPGHPLFSGRLAEFWRRLCHSLPSSPQATNLYRATFSIAQSKKGFHPVPESFVAAAYQKHATILSTPETGSVDTNNLQAFLNSFFRHFRPTSLRSQLGKSEGSTSASNLNPRSLGGAREDIRNTLRNHPVFMANPDGLIRMVETVNGVVEEKGMHPLSKSEWDQLLSLPIDHRYRDLPEQSYLGIPAAWMTTPFAKVRAVTEPLKVRIITAMNALSSYISHVLQKALWDYLARFPCFRLITESFSEDAVHQLLKQHRTLFGADSEWDFVSGDYSAATDNLKISATKLAFETVMGKLSPSDQILRPHFEEILFEQVLIYPRDSKVKVTLQKNGQLMGSVLSFVFLCVLNLYTYFRTLEPSVQSALISGKLSYKCLPVLINGDDILFRANRVIYDRWKAAGKELGFILSLGKNFVHPRFFTINSLPLEYISGCKITPPRVTQSNFLFHTKEGLITDFVKIDSITPEDLLPTVSSRPDTFRILGFPNLGLLIGLSKTASATNKFAKVLSLNGWFEGATTGALYPEKMTNYFLKYHRNSIKAQTKFGTRTLNIYAHPYLGGLGFPIPEGVVPSYSEHQRALAAHLMSAAEREFFGHSSDHPLKNFTYLNPSSKPTPSIGSRPGRVYTRLTAPVGPLLNSEDPFRDSTTIHSTPLAMAYGDLENTLLTPTCRLSNAELHKLLKKANHQCMPVRPVELMHVFPFRVVMYDPELDPVPQDDPTIVVVEEPVSTITPLVTSSEPQEVEDWELPSALPESLPVPTPSPILTSPVIDEFAPPTAAFMRRVIALERRSAMRSLGH